MKKLFQILVLTALLSTLFVTTALAGGPDKTDGFVCPVLGGKAGEAHGNSAPTKIVGPIGEGDYTIIGPDVSVPIHATNADGNGIPNGSHANPGDTDYTAIWGSK